MINFHIEGVEMPLVVPVSKSFAFIKELEKSKKEWRLGSTC
jgi:hypothetical protein